MDFLRTRHSGFSEPELWHLLYALCAAQEESLSIAGSPLGDVRPQNVFLSDKGKIKLACPYSWPSQPTASARLLEGDPAFLPPEDIDSLRSGDRKNLGGEPS